MVIFIPRGGSFTWGRSGLMRWGSPIDRRHSIGDRMAVVKDSVPPETGHRFIGRSSAGRSQVVSFGTQFGGDFSFSFRLASNWPGTYVVFCAVNEVDVWSQSISATSSDLIHWPFKVDVKNVPPQGVIRFDLNHPGGVRSGLRFDPVLSERMGAVQPRIHQAVYIASPVTHRPLCSAVADAGLGQTPPIRVISPSWVRRVPH